MRYSPHRLAAKAVATVIAAALMAIGGAVVPANAVIYFSLSGHVDLGSLGASAGAGEVIVSYARAGYSPESEPLGSVPTDAAGNFTFPALSVHDYSLFFDYVGSGSFSSRFWLDADTMWDATYFPLSENVSGKNIVLPPLAAVSGVVSFNAAGSHPEGLSARVTWDRDSGFNWIPGPSEGVVTDANGAFSFLGRPGEYRLHVVALTGDFQARTVLVTHGMTSTTAQDTVVIPWGSIVGHVYLGDSSVSAGAGDVRIYYRVYCSAPSCYPRPTDPFATTDALGDFVIPHLVDSNWHLWVSYAAGPAFQELKARPTAAIVDGATVTLPSLTLLPSASISGRVSLGSTETYAAVGEVTVTAGTDVGGSFLPFASASTDAEGDYTIVGLREGSYRLRFHHNSAGAYSDLWWSNAPSQGESTMVNVTSTELSGFDATMTPGASFTGVLKNSSGAALVGYEVTAHRYAAGSSTLLDKHKVLSGADGSFALTGLPAGRYLIDVYKYPVFDHQWIGAIGKAMTVNLSNAITMAAGEEHPFGDVAMLRTAVVSGSLSCGVTCGYGRFARLYYLDPEDGWVDSGPGNSSGISFSSLIPGTYQLRAGFSDDPTFEPYVSASFTLSEGEYATRDVLLQPGTLPVARLVKSNAPGATTVYLVDSFIRLVPVPTIAAATDAGVPAAVISVAPASLSNYHVMPAMTKVVTCLNLTYFATGGQLWPIDPALVPSFSQTSLYTSTCIALPRSTTTIRGGLFLQASATAPTYYITASGEKRRVTDRVSMGALSYPYWPIVLGASDAFLGTLPTGTPIVPYFGKRPLPAQAPAVTANVLETTTPVSTLTVDQRVTCYSAYFQALGAGLFAPLTQNVTLDANCRRELGMDLVRVG